MEVKDKIKRAAAHIKILATSKSDTVNYDSDKYIRVTCNKKASTGVLPSRKHHGKNTPKHNRAQYNCVLCKKAGIPKQKWKYISSENSFRKRYNKHSVKYGLGGPLGNRADAVNNYQ